MSHTVTLELSDEEFEPIRRQAEATGLAPAEVIRARLRQAGPSDRELSQPSGIVDEAAVQVALVAAVRELAPRQGKGPEEIVAEWRTRLHPILFRQPTAAERQRTLELLLPLFGSVDTGDPHSADNERIDADLAREYGSTHDEDA